MPTKSSANLGIQIPAGPNFTLSWVIEADTYDRSTFAIPGNGTKTLQLQTGIAPKLLFLAIVVPSGDYSGGVTYDFAAVLSATPQALNGPQIIAGADLAKNAAIHNGLTVHNPAATAVTIDVLVLRTAVA